jgi:hypothetical protein
MYISNRRRNRTLINVRRKGAFNFIFKAQRNGQICVVAADVGKPCPTRHQVRRRA